MAESLDTGDIIASRSVNIGGKTSSELQSELAATGAELICVVIKDLENGAAKRIAQDEKLATYAQMLSKADGHLDFRESPEKLERLIRGLDPWPGAYTVYNGSIMKIWEALPINEYNSHEPGTIIGISEDSIDVSAGGNVLRITGIQMPGKKKMKIREYLKGNKIEKFNILR
jgi:methionyl-tRNA formyltransferase